MASAMPTGSEPDQVELPPAAAQPPPAQTEQDKQEEVRKRIELISGLELTLNTSVLQVMSSQRGSSSLPGSPDQNNSDSVEQRMATARTLIAGLDDEVALSVLRDAGFLDALLDVALENLSRSSDQVASVMNRGEKSQNGFFSYVQERECGTCIFDGIGLAAFGSEAYGLPVMLRLIRAVLEGAEIFIAKANAYVLFLEVITQELEAAQFDVKDFAPVQILTTYWATILDIDDPSLEPSAGEMELAGVALRCTVNLTYAYRDDVGPYVAYAEYYGMNPETADSEFSIWLAFWHQKDGPGHIDVFTKSSRFKLDLRGVFSLRNRVPGGGDATPIAPPRRPPSVDSAGFVHAYLGTGQGSRSNSSGSQPSRPNSPAIEDPNARLPADERVRALQAAAKAGLPFPVPGQAPVPVVRQSSTGELQHPAIQDVASNPYAASVVDEQLEDLDARSRRSAVQMSPPKLSSAAEERLALERLNRETELLNARHAAEVAQAAEAKAVAALRAHEAAQSAMQDSLNHAQGIATALTTEVQVSTAEAEIKALREAHQLSTVTDKLFWEAAGKGWAVRKNAKTVASTPYDKLDGIGLTHHQMQVLRGIVPLGDPPKLSIGQAFEPTHFRVFKNWFNALLKKIGASTPGKAKLCEDMYQYAVDVYGLLLEVSMVRRNELLTTFHTKVTEFDMMDQALARLWCAWILLALPNHIVAKINNPGNTAKWARLLGDGVNVLESLDLSDLHSVLHTFDGALIITLLEIFDNVGDKRLILQNYLIGVQPATAKDFQVRYSSWVDNITLFRGLGITMPDASLFLKALLVLIKKLRLEYTQIDFYLNQFELEQLGSPVLSHELPRVLEIMHTVATRIDVMLTSGMLTATAKTAPKAKTPAPELPHVLQVQAKPKSPKGKAPVKTKAPPAAGKTKPAPPTKPVAPKAPNAKPPGAPTGKGKGKGGKGKRRLCVAALASSGLHPSRGNQWGLSPRGSVPVCCCSRHTDYS